MEYMEFTGKTVEDAITEATIQLGTTSDNIKYEVVEKGSNGLLGLLGGKQARIRVETKKSIKDVITEFLSKVFAAMNLTVEINIEVDEEARNINIDLSGEEMGILIGKRGQTLDSLQYLISLVANRESDNYMRVKLDTENYRQRRKETLENLAKNLSYKVKRTKRSVSLEPMNPYERRIIHSALQNDKYVTTKSEGEEPFRYVVIVLKK